MLKVFSKLTALLIVCLFMAPAIALAARTDFMSLNKLIYEKKSEDAEIHVYTCEENIRREYIDIGLIEIAQTVMDMERSPAFVRCIRKAKKEAAKHGADALILISTQASGNATAMLMKAIKYKK